MAQVLRRLTPASHDDLVVGSDANDDAVVWRRPNGAALVASVDVFTPIVDDAATWGRIAAVNAASDVYAMGGRPMFALAIAAWPREELSLDLLGDVLAGGVAAAQEGGWVVAGGHTLAGTEPIYGQAVVGEADPDRLLRNDAGRPGDALVLTKPLGTGLVATAVKRREPDAILPAGALAQLYAEAVAEMTRTNGEAATAVLDLGGVAATDVTGFGLLGHLRELCVASGVGARLDAAAAPRLHGLDDVLEPGEVPGGTRRNLEHVHPHLDVAGTSERDLLVLADAQTSGGLLVALPDDRATELVDRLVATGHRAGRIGVLTDATDGTVVVRG